MWIVIDTPKKKAAAIIGYGATSPAVVVCTEEYAVEKYDLALPDQLSF